MLFREPPSLSIATRAAVIGAKASTQVVLSLYCNINVEGSHAVHKRQRNRLIDALWREFVGCH